MSFSVFFQLLFGLYFLSIYLSLFIFQSFCLFSWPVLTSSLHNSLLPIALSNIQSKPKFLFVCLSVWFCLCLSLILCIDLCFCLYFSVSLPRSHYLPASLSVSSSFSLSVFLCLCSFSLFLFLASSPCMVFVLYSSFFPRWVCGKNDLGGLADVDLDSLITSQKVQCLTLRPPVVKYCLALMLKERKIIRSLHRI